MSNVRTLACIVMILFFIAGTAMAQAPGGPPRGGPGFGRGGRGGPPGRGDTERLVDDLTLTNQQRNDAHAALLAYDQTIRQQTLQARSELLDKMKTIMTDEQFSQFKDDLEQVPLLPPVPPQSRGIATTDMVDRLMSYDKNHDGLITRDELPERMLNLLEEGDTNHDGALDAEEIRNLADRASLNDQPPGRGGGRGRRGGPPPGGFGPGAFPPPPPQDQQ